jgi:hypothetical protein
VSVFTSDVTVEAGSTNVPVTVATPLPAGTNVIGHVIADSGSTTAVTALPSIPAGANAIGSVSVSNFPATQPVSGTVSATQGTSPWVVSGTVTTSAPGASTATITRVATSTTAATLLAANVARKKAVIMTELGTQTYIAYGSVASATNYTYVLGATTSLEIDTWQGSISAIRASGTGNVQVTELV